MTKLGTRFGGGGAGAAADPVASGARVLIVAAQSLAATANDQVIAWDGEAHDAGGYHDTVTNNSRLTVPTALGGTFSVGGLVWTTTTWNGGNYCTVRIRKNGTTQVEGAYNRRVLGSGAAIHGAGTSSVPVVLAGGDYVEFLVSITDGGARALDAARCAFWIVRIGD